uniref:Uncharacterized protein n=1 Tax=Arundo donax TaxID=35708 RepID=A0A0A9E6D3_ARUDO
MNVRRCCRPWNMVLFVTYVEQL